MKNYKKYTKIDLSERKYLDLESRFSDLSIVIIVSHNGNVGHIFENLDSKAKYFLSDKSIFVNI